MTGKELQDELTWKFPHIGKEAPDQMEEAMSFCENYKAFLDEGKTERECVKKAVELLKAAGYTEFDTQGLSLIHISEPTRHLRINRNCADLLDSQY